MRLLAAVFLSFTGMALLRPATAAECAGVNFADTVQIAGRPLVLNGLGMREATMFKVDVYVAGLYVPEKFSLGEDVISAPGPKLLALKFVRAVSTEDLTGAWTEGFEKAAGGKLAELQPSVDRLNRWMEAVGKGETLEFTYVPERGTDIAVRGTTKGTIPGAEFAMALFAIWFGSEPPNEGLKTGLLGGACG
jgi:hypothetical protein